MEQEVRKWSYESSLNLYKAAKSYDLGETQVNFFKFMAGGRNLDERFVLEIMEEIEDPRFARILYDHCEDGLTKTYLRIKWAFAQ